MRILALDVGEKRIGVAVSDPLGMSANPLQAIHCSSLQDDMKRIQEFAAAYGVERIVVGLPLKMDGSVGPQAKKVEKFARRLRDRISLPVVTWDERLSTSQAERVLIAADVSRERRREKTDQLAAALILQSYLDAQDNPNRGNQ